MDYILTLGNVPDSCVTELVAELASRGTSVAGTIRFDPGAQYIEQSDAEAAGIDELIEKYMGDVGLREVVAVIRPEEGSHPHLGQAEWDWVFDRLLFTVFDYRVYRFDDDTERFFLRAIEVPVGFSEVVPGS